MIGLIVPASSPALLDANRRSTSAAASPFVVAISIAGIKILPSIINASLLVFVMSAANSDLYIGSRTLYALAAEGKAPAMFARCSKNGLPYMSLIFCSAFCGLAFVLFFPCLTLVANELRTQVPECVGRIEARLLLLCFPRDRFRAFLLTELRESTLTTKNRERSPG